MGEKEIIEMIYDFDQEGYIPAECCNLTNTETTQGGEAVIDDADMPCCLCDKQCDQCVVEKIF